MTTWRWTWSCHAGRAGTSAPSWSAAPTWNRSGRGQPRLAMRIPSTPPMRRPVRCTTGTHTHTPQPQPRSSLPSHRAWACAASPHSPVLSDRCLDYILEEIKHSPKVNVMVASHNEDTVKFTLRRWVRLYGVAGTTGSRDVGTQQSCGEMCWGLSGLLCAHPVGSQLPSGVQGFSWGAARYPQGLQSWPRSPAQKLFSKQMPQVLTSHHLSGTWSVPCSRTWRWSPLLWWDGLPRLLHCLCSSPTLKLGLQDDGAWDPSL